MKALFSAPPHDANGPKRTFHFALQMSAFGGKADMEWCGAVQMFANDPKRTSVENLINTGRPKAHRLLLHFGGF
jgi:hypothetical protein